MVSRPGLSLTPHAQSHAHALSHGVMFCLIANAAWATQVLYWPLVEPAGPVELLAHRIVWSALICIMCVVALRRRPQLADLLGDRRQVLLLGAAGACLGAAWGLFIYAVLAGRVVESSLGLFLLPLGMVLTGVVGFGERLRWGQWTAVGTGAIATGALAVSYGRLPWIALSLCVLTVGYALLKKLAQASVLEGFSVECLLMAGPALAFLVWLVISGHNTVGTISLSHTALVVASGIFTTIPLLAYAASLTRLPLTLLGLLQYLNPLAQFAIGVVVFREDMSSTRWLGFALIWLALAIFSADSIRHQQQRRLADTAEAAT